MTFNRIGRILVCLLLVCCLIVNISLVKAHATEAFVPKSYSEENMDSLIVAGAIVVGLGILAESDSVTFDSVVEDSSSSLTSNSTYSVISATDGATTMYYVPVSDVEAVRTSLITGSIIATKDVVGSDGFVSAGTQIESSEYGTITVNVDSFAFFAKSTLCVFNAAGGYPSVSFDSGSSASIFYGNTAAGTKYYYQLGGISKSTYSYPSCSLGVSDAVKDYWAGELSFSPRIQTTVASGLVGGVVAATSVSFAKGYETWSLKTIQLYQWSDGSYHNEPEPNNNNSIAIPYIPLGVKDTYADTVTQTQQDVWEGSVSVPGSESGTGSGTISGTVTLPSWLSDGLNNLLDGLKDISSTLLAIPAAIASAIWSTLPAWLQEGITNLTVGFADILETLISIPGAIVDGITGALTNTLTWAFAISDTFIATKVDALTLKYPYLDTFLALGVDLKTFLLGLGTTPPVIYINLGATNGSYNIGGQEVFMDLSWYAAYKPTMDAVLGGFIWLWLAWRIYLSIPGIISGASGVWGAFSRHGERSMRAGNKGGTE